MNQLTITNLSDGILRRLKQLAAAHGVSVEEEGKRVLAEKVDETALPPKSLLTPRSLPEESEEANRAFADFLLTFPNINDEDEWIFDRHDLRYGQSLLPDGEDFKAHLLALSEFGDDLDLEGPRSFSGRHEVEL